MKSWICIALMLGGIAINAQDFECDGAAYIVVYGQSLGRSVLYKVIQQSDTKFVYEATELSETRRLTGLAYNVLDKHLYALDADTYELIRIYSDGTLEALRVPENIDSTLLFNAGTISPDGAGIFFFAYDQEREEDIRFYTLNLSRENFYIGYLGVTGENPVSIHDFATDPTTGLMYGYDNKQNTLVQIGIGGEVASLSYPNTGVSNISGVFFNRKGDFFAYSAQRGMYALNKQNGEMQFLGKGPEGTHGDACSCPYSYQFEKDISPRNILPCEEFEVTYTYINHLGIGQTWLTLRDTFPEGFEIVSIDSDILSSINIVDTSPNILALENIIYLMDKNEIKVTVRASDDFQEDFESRAVQWDFPIAFDEVQYSDDPATMLSPDPTAARIIQQDEVGFDNMLSANCTGDAITISAPIRDGSYSWSTGDTTQSIAVSEPGWYSLRAVSECVIYSDSVFIDEFPGQKIVSISGLSQITLGQTIELKASLDRGNPSHYLWYIGDEVIECVDCSSIEISPASDITIELEVEDDEGCLTLASHDIFVEEVRYFTTPNAFSPNGDGINDRFYLSSSLNGKASLHIYNRWGAAVYENPNFLLNDENNGWDGKFRDEYLSSGVYIWLAEIEYFDGFTEKKSGTITIFSNRL